VMILYYNTEEYMRRNVVKWLPQISHYGRPSEYRLKSFQLEGGSLFDIVSALAPWVCKRITKDNQHRQRVAPSLAWYHRHGRKSLPTAARFRFMWLLPWVGDWPDSRSKANDRQQKLTCLVTTSLVHIC
jgi:hypothetical protein